ncbi:hypothetical protein D3C85_1242360 [compost metagenome]
MKCSAYDEKENKCKNGFMRIHAVCWGGNAACTSCGSCTSKPDCMREDLPAHLIPFHLRGEK